MNIDIFNNYELQREELLARIAKELQLDKTRLQRMETAYNAVSELLKKDVEFFNGLEISVYPQGSVKIGTTVKPINGDDFDLDTVLHIYDLYSNHSPTAIYNALVRVIESDDYYKSIREKKDRCVRLNYKSDFHMDILPGCLQELLDKEKIAIPEKQLQSWSSGNPKGFSNWFLNISDSVQKSMLRSLSDTLYKAQVESEPLPAEIYLKAPLQIAVQLIKRNRDIYFQNKQYPVSSIVLTTLIASYYDGEESIFEIINNVIGKIQTDYNHSILHGTKFKIYNPVDSNEEFTDSWTEENYRSFSSFINDLFSKWQKLKQSFETSSNEYMVLFGESVYTKSLKEQYSTFSKTTKNEITKAGGLIMKNEAYTNSKGQINTNHGTKNEPHRNFGGI